MVSPFLFLHGVTPPLQEGGRHRTNLILSFGLLVGYRTTESLALADTLTRTHALALAHTLARTHALALAHTRSLADTLARTHDPALARAWSQADTLGHTRPLAHALAHTRSLAHAHAHARTPSPAVHGHLLDPQDVAAVRVDEDHGGRRVGPIGGLDGDHPSGVGAPLGAPQHGGGAAVGGGDGLDDGVT
ncbi:MAG: hypothetical protein K9H11_18965, partial [Rhodospirillum sp.]|nr:hypothetical protein [Rhodospirillum sp.]